MSDDLAVIFGIALVLWLGGVIGWWLSSRWHENRYNELLQASIAVNKITIDSLQKTMKEIRERKEKGQKDA